MCASIAEPAPSPPPRRRAATALAIAALAIAAYLPAFSNGFVNFDDDRYVTSNPMVRGLSWEGVRWAFSTFYEGNWHPLTWLSHMLDGTLFGLDSRGHHATSIALHAANAALLFLALARLTGAPRPSALAAALFAVHPLNVESVAWVAERKNVLSTLFWIAALCVAATAARRPSPRRSAALFALLALGLMAKPMLVTLPVVLLLLDAWPLARLSARAGIEKAPLFALALVSGVVTIAAQRSGRAVVAAEQFPLRDRVANALLSYRVYIEKLFWPSDLSVQYPMPGSPGAPSIDALSIIATAALLAAVTIACLAVRRRAPWLAVGWLWYVVALLPVIGLLQVGSQARADRYMYVPAIGLLVAIAWSVPGVGARWPWRAPGDRRALSAAGALACAAVVAALALATARQTARWRDSVTLFSQALAVNPKNGVAHNNLGVALASRGRQSEATAHFAEAVRHDPGNAEARSNLGMALLRLGTTDAAIKQLAEAVRLRPDFPEANKNLGLALAERGDTGAAIAAYRRAIAARPDYAAAHKALGVALMRTGDVGEAIARFEAAIRLDPRDPGAHNNLGAALAGLGRIDEAVPHFEEALRLDPRYEEARKNLARARVP
jgi:Flp pilus assembly protein TadD